MAADGEGHAARFHSVTKESAFPAGALTGCYFVVTNVIFAPCSNGTSTSGKLTGSGIESGAVGAPPGRNYDCRHTGDGIRVPGKRGQGAFDPAQRVQSGQDQAIGGGDPRESGAGRTGGNGIGGGTAALTEAAATFTPRTSLPSPSKALRGSIRDFWNLEKCDALHCAW